MGFIKNVHDTLDPWMRQYMLLEVHELSSLWAVARGAYICSMHEIEEGQIT